jgi:hypothetical protein
MTVIGHVRPGPKLGRCADGGCRPANWEAASGNHRCAVVSAGVVLAVRPGVLLETDPRTDPHPKLTGQLSGQTGAVAEIQTNPSRGFPHRGGRAYAPYRRRPGGRDG